MRASPYLLAAAASACGMSASATAAVPEAMVVAASHGPLELAHFVDRHADRYILARLGASTSIEVQLAAIRAAPFLRAPERALDALAVLAAGRDPTLAPEAMRAALDIATSLDPRELDAREVERGSLHAALVRLRVVERDESARADLRRAASFACDALVHLRVPE